MLALFYPLKLGGRVLAFKMISIPQNFIYTSLYMFISVSFSLDVPKDSSVGCFFFFFEV